MPILTASGSNEMDPVLERLRDPDLELGLKIGEVNEADLRRRGASPVNCPDGGAAGGDRR